MTVNTTRNIPNATIQKTNGIVDSYVTRHARKPRISGLHDWRDGVKTGRDAPTPSMFPDARIGPVESTGPIELFLYLPCVYTVFFPIRERQERYTNRDKNFTGASFLAQVHTACAAQSSKLVAAIPCASEVLGMSTS